jgi:hypothetical protein
VEQELPDLAFPPIDFNHYWQDSQISPLRIASIEQALGTGSGSVAAAASTAGRRSRLALSMVLLLSVRR